MRLALITKRELEVMNKIKLRYPLAIAEKDYFLAVVSKIIYNSSLRGKLVFKGGTAIHHCYLGEMRFSEDLDFTSLDQRLKIAAVKKVFTAFDFLEVKKEFISPATIKIERLAYNGPLGLSNSIKVEIDCKQNVVLPPKEISYKNAWKVDTKVKAMDPREICAEKVRATSDRARFRDFYDLFLILRKFNPSLREIIKLIKQKEIRKPISKKSILSNWEIVREEKTGGTQRLYYRKEIAYSEIEDMLKRFRFKVIE